MQRTVGGTRKAMKGRKVPSHSLNSAPHGSNTEIDEKRSIDAATQQSSHGHPAWLAGTGCYIAGLWLAILAYTSATLLVIVNSLRLLAAPKQP